ncbi:MAG: amino acid permease, partial [Bdellovibrionota bacterium]
MSQLSSEVKSSNIHLDRSLGIYQAVGLVIGSIIGSGIFVSSSQMSRILPSGSQLIGVWIFAGFMTTLGALTQAELCSRMPVTGGLYTYFRELFGPALGFFYGWANFMIAGSGAIAAIAFIFAGYLGEFVPLWQPPQIWQTWPLTIPYLGILYPAADLGEKLVGSALILFLTALNARGVKLGARLQSASVTAKTLAILIIIFIAFSFAEHGTWQHLARAP